MSASENKAFISRYLDAINGKEKPAAVVDQFISEADALLKQHIAGYEAAFPRYALIAEDMIAEADKVVVRFTFRATYGGGFMNIPATGAAGRHAGHHHLPDRRRQDCGTLDASGFCCVDAAVGQAAVTATRQRAACHLCTIVRWASSAPARGGTSQWLLPPP